MEGAHQTYGLGHSHLQTELVPELVEVEVEVGLRSRELGGMEERVVGPTGRMVRAALALAPLVAVVVRRGQLAEQPGLLEQGALLGTQGPQVWAERVAGQLLKRAAEVEEQAEQAEVEAVQLTSPQTLVLEEAVALFSRQELTSQQIQAFDQETGVLSLLLFISFMELKTHVVARLEMKAHALLPEGWKMEAFIKHLEEAGNKILKVEEDRVLIGDSNEPVLYK